MMACGDSAKGVAFFDHVILPVHALFGRQAGKFFPECLFLCEGYEQPVRPCRVGCPAVKARVQGIQFIHVQAGKLRGDCQVDLFPRIHLGEVLLVGYRLPGYTVLFRVGDQFGHGQQAGYVALGLPGQAQGKEVGILAGALVAPDRPGHVPLAGVVCGQGQ